MGKQILTNETLFVKRYPEASNSFEASLSDELQIVTSYTAYYDDKVNAVYYVWERVSKHQGGVTVKHPESGTFWMSVNEGETPSELAKHYSEKGIENPSLAAYNALQKSLCHYLEGYFLTVKIKVQKVLRESGIVIVLAEDSISTDFSTYYWNSEREAALECIESNFDKGFLVEQAKEKLSKIRKEL